MKTVIKNCATTLIILFVSLTQYKCNTNRQESPIQQKLQLQKVMSIKVAEPSGLTLSFDKNYFWCVGDSDSLVFKLDLNGNILKTFLVNGEDLEGVTVVDSVHIAVVLERTREVVVLDTAGKEIKRKKFNLKGRLNEGLEGICYDSSKKEFYFINEKRPGLLIKTDSSFTEIFKRELKFAKDYSDLFFSHEDSSLWILSDESNKIVKTDLNGNRILEYQINVEQPEGLVVDYINKKVFIVSDKLNKLYEFILP